MASYGPQFEFRIPPRANDRLGRFTTDSTTYVIGAGVSGTGTFDAVGREIVQHAAASTPPVKGRCGIVVYEYIIYQGVDPVLTTWSDLSTTPANSAIQVVSGPNVKVVFKNTADFEFLNTRDYPGRIMVAGAGATPTVAVGDYLEPISSPNDTAGYWQETSTKANAWFVVNSVNTARGEVEAQFLF